MATFASIYEADLSARAALLAAKQRVRKGTTEALRFERVATNLLVTETELVTALAPAMAPFARFVAAGPAKATAIGLDRPARAIDNTFLGLGLPRQLVDSGTPFDSRIEEQLRAIALQANSLNSSASADLLGKSSWLPLAGGALLALAAWRSK